MATRPTQPILQPAQQKSYKNQLQEYTHKARLPLPVYQTVKQERSYVPMFTSRVRINGVEYSSSGGFTQLKAAEQDAARVALSSLSLQPLPLPLPEIVKEDICRDVRTFINEDTTFCKTILNEYAAKKHMENPVYATIETWRNPLTLSSSVVLDGIRHNGDGGRNKKEAEQLAARACILFILDSENGEVINDVIKSKINLYVAVNGLKGASSSSNDVPVVTDVGTDFPSSETSLCTPNVPSIVENAPPFVHESKKPKVEANLTTPIPLITFVPGSSEAVTHYQRKNRKSKTEHVKTGRLSSVVVRSPPVTQE